jgi:hypothetical protein
MSTRVIHRTIAIQRVKHITDLIKANRLSELELASYELIPPTEAVIPMELSMTLETLPIEDLEEVINQPFYRFHNQDIYTLGD